MNNACTTSKHENCYASFRVSLCWRLINHRSTNTETQRESESRSKAHEKQNGKQTRKQTIKQNGRRTRSETGIREQGSEGKDSKGGKQKVDLNDEPPHRVADARYITTEFIRALVRVPMTAKNVNCRKLNVSTSRVQDNKSRPRTYRMKRDGARAPTLLKESVRGVLRTTYKYLVLQLH